MPTFHSEPLKQIGTQIFASAGATSDEARIVSEALVAATLAGHAGGMDNPGAPVVLPYELWAGLVGMAVLLLITIAWLAGNAWHLHKIDRRLRLLEEKQRQ